MAENPNYTREVTKSIVCRLVQANKKIIQSTRLIQNRSRTPVFNSQKTNVILQFSQSHENWYERVKTKAQLRLSSGKVR